jgi:GntR family transcriptional regulator / MocR family aminotransferase
MDISFVLDRAGPVPLHRQIYDQWRAGILSRRFHPGERVPSSRSFAGACAVARLTVTTAYDQLLAEGYFETRHGAGTFISSALPDEISRPVRVSAGTAAGANKIRLSSYGSRLGAIQRLPASASALNLSNVSPDLTLFPFPLWRRLVSRHLRRASPALFDHGARPAGHDGLREAIAMHLARTRAVRCSPEQVIVVSGSQQALDLCTRLLLDPGDEAAVEEPGYPGVRQLFLANGGSLGTLPVTDTGASISGLTDKTRLAHVTPSHQFPTGVSMSLARRLELIGWARKNGAVLLEDDYDSEYRYSGPPLPAMHSLADGGGVIYIGTFSNVMFRGLRLGYLVVPKELIAPFTTAKWMADRHTTLLEQAALADFLTEGHLDRHIRRMRRLYKRRRDVLLDALDRYFHERVAIRGDAAGLHLTATFARGSGVRARAAENGVHLTGTGIYYLSKPVPDEFILGFAAIGERTIREAVKRLAVQPLSAPRGLR